MAFIIQRSNRWFAVWRNNGKRVCKTTGISVKGNAEKKLAQATADAMEAAAKQSTTLSTALDAVRTAAATLGCAGRVPSIKEYLENYKVPGSDSNKQSYQRAIAIFLDFLGQDAIKRIDTLSASTCKEFFMEELERIAYGTVKRYKAALNAIFKSAENDDLIPHNPISRVSLGKIATTSQKKPTRRLPFTKDEMTFLLHYSPEPWKDLILTSFLTGGQRIGDVALLKWEHIDFEDNLITFDSMKTSKDLRFPMHPQLRAMLLKRINNNSPFVFPRVAQRYMRSSGSLSCEFTTLLRNFGMLAPAEKGLDGDRRSVPVKCFHSIRHTVVSLLRSSNIFSADVTREVVGHDSEAVERAYFSLDDATKARAYNYLLDSVAKKEGEQ